MVSAGPVTAADHPLETLKRTGKWTANFDRDSCQLLAQFGEGDSMVIMQMTRYAPSDGFSFSVFGKRFSTFDNRIDATLDFGLKGKPLGVKGLAGTAGDYKAMFFNSQRLDGWERKSPDEDAPPVTPQQEAAVSGVTIAIKGKRPFHLDFGSLAKPMETLRQCTTSLVKSWGYDPQVQATLSREVKALDPRAEWLRSEDYPKNSAMLGHNGIVQFRLDVDAEGKIEGCYVLARTSPDEFADLTCKLVKQRAKLSPALDANGKPVRAFLIHKVQWLMGRP